MKTKFIEGTNENRLSAALKYAKEWAKANPNLITSNSGIRSREIHKSYVAAILGLKMDELPNDVYQNYRNRLLFKRKVAKEHNINIHSLK